ncbi:MAG TPA: hypothetical protein VHC22_12920 [Pirellulales bacterium]|nr:hypothetical protein [Pirellulales bacterium]
MQQQQTKDGFGVRNSVNLAYAGLVALTRCVTPFLRDKIGAEANGLPGLLALVGLLIYIAHMHDDRMVTYLVAWFIGLAVQRIDSLVARARGMLIHSHYAGRPRLAMLVAPFVKNEGTAKLIVEPLICLFAAWLLADWSVAAAKLVTWAAAAIVIVEVIDRLIHQRREQAAIDARLEMDTLANGVRERLGY